MSDTTSEAPAELDDKELWQIAQLISGESCGAEDDVKTVAGGLPSNQTAKILRLVNSFFWLGLLHGTKKTSVWIETNGIRKTDPFDGGKVADLKFKGRTLNEWFSSVSNWEAETAFVLDADWTADEMEECADGLQKMAAALREVSQIERD